MMYKLLLRLFPRAWRAEYSAEMESVFAKRRAGIGSPWGLLSLWLETIADVVPNALGVHADLLAQDLRYTARKLRRSPGFTVAAVAIAAVGIGATTAAFTLVDHVVLRPLPYAHPDRLVRLYEDHLRTGEGFSRVDVSPANFSDWKRLSHSFASLGAYRALSVNFTGHGDPQTVDGASVTPEILPLLGVQPSLGRWFRPEEDREAAGGTVVLSYGLWQDLYGGDRAVLGRVVDLYDTPYTVIGVMPKGFYFPTRDARLWTSMRWTPEDLADRHNTYVFGLGLLKPGLDLQRAQAEMSTVASQMALAWPKDLQNIGASVVPMRDDFNQQARLMLRILLGAAACVLLIACSNLANLLLARAMLRRRELAVRTALGAGRERLIRQMLTESVVLALAGGLLGIGVAYVALPMLARLVPVALPIAEVPPIDGTVLAFALGLTCLTGAVFGLVPALRVCGSQNAAELHEGGRSGTGARREHLRSALVVVEVAGSIVLLVGFGLLTRALWKVQSVDPGFRAERVITLRTALPLPRYEEGEAREPFYRRVLAGARALPGVTGAAYIGFLPMMRFGGIWPVEIQGHPEPVNQRRTASFRFVTPDYFRTMGIPLLTGRDVGETDGNEKQYVALVSQSFVRRYWAGESPLGHTINVGNKDRVVIGVVGDVKFRGLERSSEPQVYAAWKQTRGVSPWYSPKDLVVRAAGDPSQALSLLLAALRRIVHDADPSVPVADAQTMEALVEAQTATRRVQLGVLGAFGAVAFLLAAVGIHSVLAFAVASRTQEIGVRMALGAQRGGIFRMAVGEGLRMAAMGIAVGAVLAWFAARLLGSLLAGLEPGDPLAFTAAIVLALAMTVAGSAVPAWRAARVDPVKAIRAE